MTEHKNEIIDMTEGSTTRDKGVRTLLNCPTCKEQFGIDRPLNSVTITDGVLKRCSICGFTKVENKKHAF